MSARHTHVCTLHTRAHAREHTHTCTPGPPPPHTYVPPPLLPPCTHIPTSSPLKHQALGSTTHPVTGIDLLAAQTHPPTPAYTHTCTHTCTHTHTHTRQQKHTPLPLSNIRPWGPPPTLVLASICWPTCHPRYLKSLRIGKNSSSSSNRAQDQQQQQQQRRRQQRQQDDPRCGGKRRPVRRGQEGRVGRQWGWRAPLVRRRRR